jgi:hypothetical protein
MTAVLPVQNIPPNQQKYFNSIPPAGLVILQKPIRVLPPLGSEGNGLPPDKIAPFSGIYDERGHLPSPASGLTFMAKV